MNENCHVVVVVVVKLPCLLIRGTHDLVYLEEETKKIP